MIALAIRMVITSFLSLFFVFQIHAGETKKVCHAEKKQGKEVQVCREVKVHKKLDGTKVPPK